MFLINVRYGTYNFNFWKDRGIVGPKPLPFVGNTWGAWKIDFPKLDRQLSAQYGKLYGIFEGNAPMLMTTDLDLIRSVFVKDFDHFVNRRVNQCSITATDS